MSEFTMKFSTSNHAFVEGQEQEVARILQDVKWHAENGYMGGPIRDSNGNEVGSWELTLPEEEVEPTPEPDEDDVYYNGTDLDENDVEFKVKYSEMEREWIPVEDAEWSERWGSYVYKGKKY